MSTPSAAVSPVATKSTEVSSSNAAISAPLSSRGTIGSQPAATSRSSAGGVSRALSPFKSAKPRAQGDEAFSILNVAENGLVNPLISAHYAVVGGATPAATKLERSTHAREVWDQPQYPAATSSITASAVFHERESDSGLEAPEAAAVAVVTTSTPLPSMKRVLSGSSPVGLELAHNLALLTAIARLEKLEMSLRSALQRDADVLASLSAMQEELAAALEPEFDRAAVLAAMANAPPVPEDRLRPLATTLLSPRTRGLSLAATRSPGVPGSPTSPRSPPLSPAVSPRPFVSPPLSPRPAPK